MNIPIAIIGLASIFPQAKTLSEYWNNIINKVDCITDVPPSRWKIADYYDPDPAAPDKTYCKRGGFIPDIDFNPLEFGLPPNILEVTDVSQLLSLLVARDALKDAGYFDVDTTLRERTGVILGVGGGQKLLSTLSNRMQYPVWEKALKNHGLSDEQTKKIVDNIKEAYVEWEENAFPGMLGNVIAGRIANRFDLGGINCVVDAACASSLGALKMAISELVEGRADMMITGGVDTDNSILMYMSFSKTPAFTTGEHPRPFDAESDGIMIGEGIGMLILKRLIDAERDNDRIYAVIKGIGSSSDGRYKSIYAPRGAGQAKALQRAYEDAGISPATVGLIEAHGTGTVVGDITEFTALSQLFGSQDTRRQYIAIGSVKSQIGHTKAAAGAASLIKVALALHHKILPPTINVNQPNPKLKIAESPFYINTESRPWFCSESRRAGVSSFGFGGTNYHAVLEEYKDSTEKSPFSQEFQSIILAAPDTAQLHQQCKATLTRLQSGLSVTPQTAAVIPQNHARVGFVANSLNEAQQLLGIAINNLENQTTESWSHPKGIYYRRTGLDTSGQVVALFSGQGAQYINMGRDLVMKFPLLRQLYEQMDESPNLGEKGVLSSIVFPPPVFSESERKSQQERLRQTIYSQAAISIFSVGLYKILQQAGFKADFLAGHSFGELTALWAAGVFDETTYFELVRARGRAMMPPPDPNFDAGTMVAVRANGAQHRQISEPLTKLIAGLGLDSTIKIANINAPDQIVLAGATSAISAIQPQLREQGFVLMPLSVSAAFHSPLVSHAQKPFAKAINAARFHSPKIPVYANSSARPYPANIGAIQEILTKHIIQPVRFQQEIENIHAAGGHIFIEFGPRDILTNLVKDILGEARPHLAIALNPNQQKNSDHQLRDAIVQLQVIGLPLTAKNSELYPAELKSTSSQSVTISGHNYIKPRVQELEKEPQHLTPNTQSLTPESLIQSFTQQQQNTARAHELYLQNQAQYTKTFYQLTEQQQKLAPNFTSETMNSLERSMMRFHDMQADTLQLHQQYLNQQNEQAHAFMNLASRLRDNAHIPQTPHNEIVTTIKGIRPESIENPPIDEISPSDGQLIADLLDVVSDKTGYPVEMLELDMDIEADLGIDSIKRVEILGTMQDRFPSLPQIEPDVLAELRTLGQIVAELNVSPPTAQSLDFVDKQSEDCLSEIEISRRSVRLHPLPPPDFLEFELPAGHVCLITGDGSEITKELARELTANEWPVVLLNLLNGENLIDDLSEEHLQKQLATITSEYGPVGIFIYLNPARFRTSLNQETEKSIIKYIFLMAKHLQPSLTQATSQFQHGRAAFMTVTQLDGAFGTNLRQETVSSAISGGLFGLTKTLYQEWPAVFCRAVDLSPALDTEQVVSSIMAELHDPNRLLVEVGYGPDGRVTLVEENER
jgi:acyl transferase domain-containing protein